MIDYTRHLFTCVRRFVRSHSHEAGAWAVEPRRDGPPEWRLWKVQVLSPGREALDLETFLVAGEVGARLEAAGRLLRAALATV